MPRAIAYRRPEDPENPRLHTVAWYRKQAADQVSREAGDERRRWGCTVPVIQSRDQLYVMIRDLSQLVAFVHSPADGRSRQLLSHLPRLVENHPGIVVVMVDLNQFPEVMSDFGLDSSRVPCMSMFMKGRPYMHRRVSTIEDVNHFAGCLEVYYQQWLKDNEVIPRDDDVRLMNED